MEITKNDQFHLTLPSNGSKIYKKNTKSNFVTLLNKPIKLTKNFEVAITEITYPEIKTANTIGKISIKRIKKSEMHRIKNGYTLDGNDLENDEKIINTSNFTIETFNNYIQNSVEILMKNVGAYNKETGYDSHHYYMHYEETRDIWMFKIHSDFAMIFEGELTKILGLKENFEYVDYNSSEKAKTDLLDKHFQNLLYIYSDIVEHQFVGESEFQLLRTLTVEFLKNQKLKTHIFQKPYYLKCSSLKIESITITIKDDQGKLIKFADGYNKVIVSLHFRPKK